MTHREVLEAHAQFGGDLRMMFERETLHDERRRMVALLERMATERTGWRGFLSRWYYAHEALRNDAANMLRDMGYTKHILPMHTRILGED